MFINWLATIANSEILQNIGRRMSRTSIGYKISPGFPGRVLYINWAEYWFDK